MRMWIGRLSVVVLVALVPSVGAGEPGAEGYWKGAIDLPGGDALEVSIDIAQHDGAWRVAFYAPAQGIRGARLTAVGIEGRAVTFRIPLAVGEPTFRGELSDDGQSIAGDFTQSGQTMRFTLSRSAKPEELQQDIYADFRRPGVAGEGLQGTWWALLESGLHRMRLVLEVWESDDELLEGSLESLDQGAKRPMGIYSFLVEGDAVWFSLLEIGAEFDGKINEDGSEITGVYRQTGQEFPLTFRRQSH